MLGFVGLALLIIAYITLITKWSHLFILIDILASFLLTIYAISISDIPFTIVNGLITTILTVKLIKNKKLKSL